MDRREIIQTVGAIIGVGSGCLQPQRATTSSSGRDAAPQFESPTPVPVAAVDGYPEDLCEKSPNSDWIPAILEPEFAPDWSGVSAGFDLSESTPVIGINRAGVARAYPISILARHEVVNDSIDIPLVVTFCPNCSSGVTAIRRGGDQTLLFGNTGFIWAPPDPSGENAVASGRVSGISYRENPSRTTPQSNLNLVMFDHETGSFWSQLLVQAICGPLTGETLSLVPSTVSTWGRWQKAHPKTTVLLPSPHSKTADDID